MTIKRVPAIDGLALLNSIKNLQNREVKVGWVRLQHYPKTDISIAEVAAVQEFGSAKRHIPARPFMRPTIAEKRNVWMRTAENGAKQILKGKRTIDEVLALVGEQAAGDIKKKIKQIFSPALAEATVLARINRNARLSNTAGRLKEKAIGNITKPLIDTGLMFDTLTYEVTS